MDELSSNMDELDLEQYRVSRLSKAKNLSMAEVCPHNIYEDPGTGVYRCLVCNTPGLQFQNSEE